MLEQEQPLVGADHLNLLSTRPPDHPSMMNTQQSSQGLYPLESLEHLAKANFSDLSYSSTISSTGSPMLTIWQPPSRQSSKGFVMKDLPLFYIVGSINDHSRLCLRLITFNGKVVSELNDNDIHPLDENSKISFVDKLGNIQLCQGVKILDPTLKLDPQTFTFLYLVEQLDQNVIVRSRQCQVALQDGKLVCDVCEALNETATNKKPIIREDGGLFPISGLTGSVEARDAEGDDVKPLIMPQANFSDTIDEDPLKEEGLLDDEYWSSNGGQLDQEDPDWNDESTPKIKKAKKLRGSRLKRGRKKIALNDGGKEIICTQCDHEEFETKKELREHLKESHGGVGLDKLSYKCSEVECSFETRTQVLLNEHKMEVHGISTTYKCKYCPDFEANTRKRLLKHVSTEHEPQEGDKPYGCKRCPSTWFRLKSELRRHVSVAHYDGPYKCDQCPFEATKRWRLHEHTRFVHDKIKPFLCDQCSQPFARRERLVRHIKAVHDKIRDYKCPHAGCPYEAARSSQLKIHITSVHEKLKPFLCEHCSYEGPTKSDITRHVKHVHATVKPFKCQHCPYETTANPGLLKHIQTVHAGIKPYKCPHCTYECAMKQQLTLHIRAIHEKVRPYTCDLCSFAAARKQEVVRHRTAVHDPSKHFVCHYCPYKSPRRHIVTQHIRKSHDRNYSPPTKKIGRRLAPDPRSQPGLATGGLQNPIDKDRNTLYNISVEEKKVVSNELMNPHAAPSQHINNQSQQPAAISQTHGATVEYHSIKVEHLPNY